MIMDHPFAAVTMTFLKSNVHPQVAEAEDPPVEVSCSVLIAMISKIFQEFAAVSGFHVSHLVGAWLSMTCQLPPSHAMFHAELSTTSGPQAASHGRLGTDEVHLSLRSGPARLGAGQGGDQTRRAQLHATQLQGLKGWPG